MIYKLIITVFSCILYGTIVGIVHYLTGDALHRSQWSITGTAVTTMIYSGPFFLLVGIPFSYAMDYFSSVRSIHYIFVALLYIISSIILAVILYIIFSDSLSLWKLSIYFATAAFTLFLGLRLFNK